MLALPLLCQTDDTGTSATVCAPPGGVARSDYFPECEVRFWCHEVFFVIVRVSIGPFTGTGTHTLIHLSTLPKDMLNRLWPVLVTFFLLVPRVA